MWYRSLNNCSVETPFRGDRNGILLRRDPLLTRATLILILFFLKTNLNVFFPAALKCGVKDLLSPPVRFRFPPLSPSSYSTTSLNIGPPRIVRRWTSVADCVSSRRGRKSRRREVNLRIACREENHSGVLPRKTLLR